MTTAVSLTRPQKAAAILVAMGKTSAGKLLKFFKQEELRALVEAARLLRTIPQSDLERIVAEFEDEFTEGAGLLDSADQMDTILTETLTPEEMNAIRGHVTPGLQSGPPVWADIEKLDSARLAGFLAGEHPQTSALVLSNLNPAAAAQALLALDKPLRGEIIKRMMSMSPAPDRAVRLLENQLRDRLLSPNTGKDISAGQIRVASLLNEMEKSQVEEVMQDLASTGATGLDEIRSRLFSFEDVVRLTQKARVALFDGLSTELVTLALRNAEPAVAEAVLSSIGTRSRRMIESELTQGLNGISAADITRARKTIASTAIRMAREGALELPAEQNAA